MLAKELIERLKPFADHEVEIITVSAKDVNVRSVYKSWDGKVKITNYESFDEENKNIKELEI